MADVKRNGSKDIEKTSVRRIPKLRPGIIDGVEDYRSDYFKADHIDTQYSNIRVGENAMFMAGVGVAEILNGESRSHNQYRLKTDDLQPVREAATHALRNRIIRELEQLDGDAEVAVEDLDEKGVKEAYNENALIKYNDGGYSDQTLKFLSNLGVIKSVDDRTFAADQTDIDYLEQNSDEWMEIAGSLSDRGTLPREIWEEKQRFPDLESIENLDHEAL